MQYPQIIGQTFAKENLAVAKYPSAIDRTQPVGSLRQIFTNT